MTVRIRQRTKAILLYRTSAIREFVLRVCPRMGNGRATIKPNIELSRQFARLRRTPCIRLVLHQAQNVEHLFRADFTTPPTFTTKEAVALVELLAFKTVPLHKLASHLVAQRK